MGGREGAGASEMADLLRVGSRLVVFPTILIYYKYETHQINRAVFSNVSSLLNLNIFAQIEQNPVPHG